MLGIRTNERLYVMMDVKIAIETFLVLVDSENVVGA